MLLLPLIGSAPIAMAQSSTGHIEGLARHAADATPIAFALVRLEPTEPRADTLRQRVTTAQGHFRFSGVPSGDYRLRLLRIGYKPIVSPVVHVRPGETLRHDLSGIDNVVQLATVHIQPGATCLTADQLMDARQLATLWAEVRNGVEIRRAFERQYRFTRIMRQEIQPLRRVGRSRMEVREDTVINEPDSVLVRDQRRLARNRARGYKTGNLVVLPDEKELLSDEFLTDHCLDTAIEEAEGVFGIHFRPTHRRRDGADVRGTVWVEAGSYQIRRLDVQHLRGNEPFSWIQVDYRDVVVGGSALRLWHSGHGRVTFGLAGLLTSGATATLRFTYQEFEPVQGIP